MIKSQRTKKRKIKNELGIVDLIIERSKITSNQSEFHIIKKPCKVIDQNNPTFHSNTSTFSVDTSIHNIPNNVSSAFSEHYKFDYKSTS